MKSKMKKVAVLVVFVIICASIFYYFHRTKAQHPAPDAVIVEAAPVKVGEVAIQAQAIGTLAAEKHVEITPEIAGHVAKILFQDGTFVKQGAPLIQLDDQVFKAKLESAKANLFLSETNYKRMTLLGKQGAVAQQAIDQALADLKEKKAIAEESQVAVDKMLLTAPFDGMVAKSKVSLGDYVSVGQSLVSLVDVLHLRVEYNVPEKYLPSLKINQIVKMTTSTYPGKEFSGVVTYISPTINTENRTITVYADIPNEERLLTAGLFVNITQFLGVEKNALLIPADSLAATIDGQVVYKIENNKAISVPVVLGQRMQNTVQVLSGLSVNDFVVTAGQQKIKDGASVEVRS